MIEFGRRHTGREKPENACEGLQYEAWGWVAQLGMLSPAVVPWACAWANQGHLG